MIIVGKKLPTNILIFLKMKHETFFKCPVCKLEHSHEISEVRSILISETKKPSDKVYIECGDTNWNHKFYDYQICAV